MGQKYVSPGKGKIQKMNTLAGKRTLYEISSKSAGSLVFSPDYGDGFFPNPDFIAFRGKAQFTQHRIWFGRGV
jgi:hypothetical protein